jgi:hypothetical protein
MGVLFGALAGLMAYVILYHEYLHHFEPRRARSMALRGALIACLFFVSLAVLAGLAILRFVGRPSP